MEFIEKSTVQLADPVARTTFFSSAHLERILAVGYRTDEMAVSGPFSPIFDEFSFGFQAGLVSQLEGWIGLPATVGSNPLSLRIEGLGQPIAVQPDAIWRGKIVARSIPSMMPIEDVQYAWNLEDIDSQIMARLGSLPSQPQLETERRNQFIANMKAISAEPDAVTDRSLQVWLDYIGAASLSDYLANQSSSVLVGVAQVKFPAPPVGASLPKPLPVSVAFLIRDASFSVKTLLGETAAVRKSLANQGIEVAPDLSAKKRFASVIGWIIPKATFSDPDWPGSSDADRENRASTWLADQGIALITK